MTQLYGILLAILLLSGSAFAQLSTGIIQGKVIDATTKQPLVDVNVVLVDSKLGAATDLDGGFEISPVPVGSYVASASRLGYRTQVITAVVVSARRIMTLDFELVPEEQKMQDLVVTARKEYFDAPQEMKVSTHKMRFEEIRRAAGGVEDIQRVVQQLPSVVSMSDEDNEVIVRGGNPNENLFILDGLELPNINHFGYQGAGGGPIGLINNEFVKDVDFMAGAFPASRDGKLSSAMEITLREGRRDRLQGNVNMSMAGAGLLLEGPLGPETSFIASWRRSYLDLIHNSVGLTAIPLYWNAQGKMTHRFTPRQILHVNMIYGDDEIAFSDSTESAYSRGAEDATSNGYEYATGFTLNSVWTPKFRTRTVAGVAENYWDILVQQDAVDWVTIDNSEQIRQLRTEAQYQAPAQVEVHFGGYWKGLYSRFHQVVEPDTLFIYDPADSTDDPDPIGYDATYTPPRLAIDYQGLDHHFGAYLEAKVKAGPLYVRPGVHIMYTAWNEEWMLSPRLAVVIPLGAFTGKLSAGLTHQPSSPSLTHIYSREYQLTAARSQQFVAGLEYRPREDVKISLEGYYKHYNNYPIPYAATTEDPLDWQWHYVNEGEGDSKGIEFFLQKRMTSGWYAIVSYSGSVAERIDPRNDEGNRFPDDYDYGHVLSISGGKKIPFHHYTWYQKMKKQWWFNTIAWLPVAPADEFELLIHYRAMGGRPYTEKTYLDLNRTWVMRGETPVNSSRYPGYSRFDIRFDRRFYFEKTNLVTYVEFENLFDHRNIYKYTYLDDGTIGRIDQFRFFFVGGFSFEF